MSTILGQELRHGDKVAQVVQDGLAPLMRPMFVVGLDEVHDKIILGESPDGPPRKKLDGSIRQYRTGRFVKL